MVQGKTPVPYTLRDRYSSFHPQILANRDQEEECDRLAGSLIQRGLLRNRLVTYSTRYTASTTPSRASAVWWNVFALRSMNGLNAVSKNITQSCSLTACTSRYTASDRWLRGVLRGIGHNRRRHTRGSWHLQHAAGKRHGLGDIFDRLKERGVQRVGLMWWRTASKDLTP